MKDFTGQEVNIGDKVVINSQTSTSGNHLTIGEVISIHKHSGMDIAKVSYHWYESSDTVWCDGFSSRKIYKI